MLNKKLIETLKNTINNLEKEITDLKLIETQQHKAEILVEYKQTLNISNAITTVMNRFEAIEEEKKKQEKLRENELQKIAESVETEEIKKEKDEFVIVPTKKEITIKFNLYEKQLQQLIKFLDLSNIEYEREDI